MKCFKEGGEVMMKIKVPELKNLAHLDKVQDWYGEYVDDLFEDRFLVLLSDEKCTIFLVETEEGGLELARVFSVGESLNISIDHQGTNDIETIQQLLLNFHRVAID